MVQFLVSFPCAVPSTTNSQDLLGKSSYSGFDEFLLDIHPPLTSILLMTILGAAYCSLNLGSSNLEPFLVSCTCVKCNLPILNYGIRSSSLEAAAFSGRLMSSRNLGQGLLERAGVGGANMEEKLDKIMAHGVLKPEFF